MELGAGHGLGLVPEAVGQLALPRRQVDQGQREGLDRVPVPLIVHKSCERVAILAF